MRVLAVFAVTLMFTAGAAFAGPVEDELIAADKAFSKLSAEKGQAEAFITYAADDARLFGGGGEPLVGKEKIKAFYTSPEFLATKPEQTSFTWHPMEAFASADGTFGWTNGHWKIVGPPDAAGKRRESTGHYISIWRKGPDGWKVVGDMGTADPPPKPASKPR